MLNMNSRSAYFLPNGKEIFHNPIIIDATRNNSALSNTSSSLSTKLQGTSPFLYLVPLTEYELEMLADSILCKRGEKTSSSFLPKIMKAHFTAAKLHELETNLLGDRDSVTLHEFLRINQFRENVHPFQKIS
jgi:hypothetical protein